MAEVDYMGYARSMGARNPIASSLNQIGETMDDNQRRDMQREALGIQQQQADRQNRLADLQVQQGQAHIADQQAQQGALQQMYGAANPQEAYVAQMKAQQVSDDKKSDMAAIKEIFDLTSKIKEKGLQPEIVSPLVQGLAGTIKDPKLRSVYENVKINPDWSSETIIPLDGTEGMLHPVTKKPLSAGIWKLKIAPDGKTPIGADFVKEIAPEPMPKHVPEGAAVPDGKGGYTIPAPKRERSIVVNTGGRGAPMGKPPAGYRYTPDGNLEAIPGGPAAQKVEDRVQGKGNAQAAIDLSISTIDRLSNHPGRKLATGKSRMTGAHKIPGTDAYDFDRELESFDAQLFLSNISAMKGMGALSNAEGMKVSAAAGAIKPGMSEKAFLDNITAINNTLKLAKKRLSSGITINQEGAAQSSTKSGGRFVIKGVK